MRSIKQILIVIGIVVFVVVQATNVHQCPGSKARKLEANDVKITKCSKATCILRRNTKATIEMKFSPSRDFKKLHHNVQGKILDVPLPFPGFDGTDACPFIYAEDGQTQVGCPIKAGTNYVYRNGIDILSFYPPVNVIVHWGLSDNKEDAVCFEVPAKIR